MSVIKIPRKLGIKDYFLNITKGIYKKNLQQATYLMMKY